MFCRKCGKEVKEGAAFCICCGAPLCAEEDKKKNLPKSKGFLAGIAVLFLTAAVAGFFLVQRAKETKAFSDRVTAFKDYCHNYQLGDLEDDYEILSEKAERIVKDKERSAYSDTESELERFEKKLQEYIAEIESYNGKRDEYALLEDFPQTDEQKGTYESLLAELEKGFEENSLLSIEQSINRFDAFFMDQFAYDTETGEFVTVTRTFRQEREQSGLKMVDTMSVEARNDRVEKIVEIIELDISGFDMVTQEQLRAAYDRMVREYSAVDGVECTGTAGTGIYNMVITIDATGNAVEELASQGLLAIEGNGSRVSLEATSQALENSGYELVD